MNAELLKKNLKKLIAFYEKKPKKTQTFSLTEYKRLLFGISFLCLNGEDIDLTGVTECFKFKGSASKGSFLIELENRIVNAKPNEELSYYSITEILEFYLNSIDRNSFDSVSTEKWVEIAGYLHSLEMERLR